MCEEKVQIFKNHIKLKKMKTIEKIFMVLIALSMCVNFSSCNKDDDDDDNDSIIGTWNNYKDTWEEDGKTETDYYDNKFFLTFNPDGTGVWNGDLIRFIKWSVKGDKLTIVHNDEYYDEEITKLITIEKLTKNELILLYDDEDNYREFYKK
jgi:hypothetical protein